MRLTEIAKELDKSPTVWIKENFRMGDYTIERRQVSGYGLRWEVKLRTAHYTLANTLEEAIQIVLEDAPEIRFPRDFEVIS